MGATVVVVGPLCPVSSAHHSHPCTARQDLTPGPAPPLPHHSRPPYYEEEAYSPQSPPLGAPRAYYPGDHCNGDQAESPSYRRAARSGTKGPAERVPKARLGSEWCCACTHSVLGLGPGRELGLHFGGLEWEVGVAPTSGTQPVTWPQCSPRQRCWIPASWEAALCGPPRAVSQGSNPHQGGCQAGCPQKAGPNAHDPLLKTPLPRQNHKSRNGKPLATREHWGHGKSSQPHAPALNQREPGATTSGLKGAQSGLHAPQSQQSRGQTGSPWVQLQLSCHHHRPRHFCTRRGLGRSPAPLWDGGHLLQLLDFSSLSAPAPISEQGRG